MLSWQICQLEIQPTKPRASCDWPRGRLASLGHMASCQAGRWRVGIHGLLQQWLWTCTSQQHSAIYAGSVPTYWVRWQGLGAHQDARTSAGKSMDSVEAAASRLNPYAINRIQVLVPMHASCIAPLLFLFFCFCVVGVFIDCPFERGYRLHTDIVRCACTCARMHIG